MKNNKPVILLDGKYYIYRALKANFVLTHNDLNTTIYYNLLSSMKAIAKKFKPDNIIIMWDSEYSRRREFYSGYKTKDNSKQDKMIQEQIRIIKFEYENIRKNLKKLGFASYLRWSLEADDLFFYYANQYPKEDIIMVSRDEDLYQLLTFPNVRMYNPHEKVFVDRRYIMNKYEIKPEQWILYKSIGGCKSDTIPGIPTIGKGRTIDYILQRATPKVVKTIENNWNIVTRNKELVTLPFLPVNKVRPLRPKKTLLNLDALKELCFDMGFKGFLKDLFIWKEIFKYNNQYQKT